MRDDFLSHFRSRPRVPLPGATFETVCESVRRRLAECIAETLVSTWRGDTTYVLDDTGFVVRISSHDKRRESRRMMVIQPQYTEILTVTDVRSGDGLALCLLMFHVNG